MEQRLGAPFVAVMLRNHGGEPGGQFFGAAEQKIPRLRRYAYALHRLMDMGQKTAPASNAREHLADYWLPSPGPAVRHRARLNGSRQTFA
jgi:hypothetical protein